LPRRWLLPPSCSRCFFAWLQSLLTLLDIVLLMLAAQLATLLLPEESSAPLAVCLRRA